MRFLLKITIGVIVSIMIIVTFEFFLDSDAGIVEHDMQESVSRKEEEYGQDKDVNSITIGDKHEPDLIENKSRADGGKPLKPFTAYKISDLQKVEKTSLQGTNSEARLYMSVNEMMYAVNNVSLKDKLWLATIARKIKKDNINRISNVLEAGITYTEIEELKNILGQDLSSDEIERLDGMLIKSRKVYAEIR